MKLKPRFLSVVAIIGFLTLLIIFGLKQNMDLKVQESKLNDSNRGVVAWINAFSEQDFTYCDDLLYDKSEGLYNLQLHILQDDSSYYDLVLNKLVNCIDAIQVTNKEKVGGVDTYTVTVTYTPYKALGDLVYDLGSLTEAKELLADGEITDSEFQEELSRVYYEIFANSCFQVDDSDARQKDLILSEKEINGVTCVDGTVSFVDSLLADSNIERNLTIYEKDVKGKVANIIKADVTP